MDLYIASGLIALLVVGLVGMRVVQCLRSVQARKELLRASRYERKLRDTRDNMGGRVFNALSRAAKENRKVMLNVEMSKGSESYWIFVKRRDGHRHFVPVMTVGISLNGTGFEMTVVDGSPSRYAGPASYFIETLIPRLVQDLKTYGIQ